MVSRIARGLFDDLIEQSEHLGVRMLRQRIDLLAVPQDAQQRRGRRPGSEQQSLQFRENIGVSETAGFKYAQDLLENRTQRLARCIRRSFSPRRTRRHVRGPVCGRNCFNGMTRRGIRRCALLVRHHSGFRRGSRLSITQQAEQFEQRVPRQRIDQTAAPQHVQQRRGRCAGCQQEPLQLRESIGVGEAACLKDPQDFLVHRGLNLGR